MDDGKLDQNFHKRGNLILLPGQKHVPGSFFTKHCPYVPGVTLVFKIILFYFSLYILDVIIQPNLFFIAVIYMQVYCSNVNK